MFKKLRPSISILVITSSLTALPDSALALEGKALLDKFLASRDMLTTNLKWGEVTEEGAGSFTLRDVVITGKSGQETNVDSVVVKALKENGGHVTYESIVVSNVKGATKKGGRMGFASIVATNGDFPSALWAGGLPAVEKTQRIKMGSISINGIAIDENDALVQIDSIALVNADIPLDYRFDPKAQYEGEPAAPLTFDKFAVSGLSGSQKQRGLTWRVASMSLTGVNFPTSIETTIDQWMRIYSGMSVNDVIFTLGGTEVFALKQFGGTLSPPDANGESKGSSTLEGMKINLITIPDPKVQKFVEQTGYKQLGIDMAGVGTYNMNTGRVAVDNMVVKMKDMLDLNMKYAITGYTPELFQAITKAQLQAKKDGNSPANLMALMPQLANIKLEGLKIALTDHSLTGKLLDFQGKQMGTSGEQLAAGAPLMLGLGMARLKMPEFTKMVTEAVGKFLKDKGTLSIEAAPAEPVPIMNVVMSGQADPTQVPKLLNLRITVQ